MIIPLTIAAALAGLAVHKAIRTDRGVMTPERQKVYDAAMISMEPDKLRQLAEKFDEMGLPEQAFYLRKRAELREMPEELKEQRREVFEKALSSDNKEAIADVASAFEAEGATGAAQRLREYLASLM